MFGISGMLLFWGKWIGLTCRQQLQKYNWRWQPMNHSRHVRVGTHCSLKRGNMSIRCLMSITSVISRLLSGDTTTVTFTVHATVVHSHVMTLSFPTCRLCSTCWINMLFIWLYSNFSFLRVTFQVSFIVAIRTGFKLYIPTIVPPVLSS